MKHIKSFNESSIKLLAPNGKKSNLPEELYRLVRTDNFIDWFGDWINNPNTASKVVDKNGEPLVVYHGSIYDFNVYDEKKKDLFGWHFGTKKAAEKVGKIRYQHSKLTHIPLRYIEENKHFNIKPFFLNIRNPYQILDVADHTKPSMQYYQIHTFFDDFKINKENLHKRDYMTCKYVADTKIELYKKKIYNNKKYDGFYYYNRYEDKRSIYPSYIVKDENQIKLADGSNIEFDVSSNDVRY